MYDIDFVCVETVDQAIQLSDRGQVELYILNVDLLDLHALELCKRIRAAAPEEPVVICSANSYEREIEIQYDAEGIAYIVQPDVERMVRIVLSLRDPVIDVWRSLPLYSKCL
jgi:DNA-binding response OmpR family regulator